MSGAEIRVLAEKAPLLGDKGHPSDKDQEHVSDLQPPGPTENWTPADQPYVGPLEKDHWVHYWSETHTQWIWTQVLTSSHDATATVDLAIKQNANRTKIRADWLVRPHEGLDGSSTWFVHKKDLTDQIADWVGHQDFAEDLSVKPKKEPWLPQKGENVQYWSPTFGKYIAATVKNINVPVDSDGEYTLDLNVKKRAPISSVYPGDAGLTHQAAPPQENTPRQPKDVPDRSQTPLRALARREDRSVRQSRTSYVRSTTTAPNSSRSRGDPEEKHVMQRTLDPEHHATRHSAQRDMTDTSAFDTSRTIDPSAVEALAPRAPATVAPTGYPSSSTSYAPGQKLVLASGNTQSRLAGPSTARKPDLKPVPEMSVASGSSAGAAYQQVSVRAGQDAREPSRLSIASPGSSLASPVGASTKAAPSFAPPAQYARSLSASTSSLSSALPSLREQLRIPMERIDVAQIGSQIVQALGGPACQVAVQNLTARAGGGQNLGIWSLTIPPLAEQIIGHKVLIVKMVNARSTHRCLDSEADNICKLAEACPAIREDPKLSFPIKVLDLIPPSGRVQQNLMIMPNAKGHRLAEYFCMCIAQGKSQELMGVLRDLGRELKLFHQRYNNRKHADFTPSNIFYDSQTKSFTFIDVGGIGTNVVERDDEHFIKSLQITCGHGQYAPHFNPAMTAFHAGYAGR